MGKTRESKIAIIGGGPTGLYLAYKLKKAGVLAKNITIYEPRTEYNRPGHVTSYTMATLEKGLGEKSWPQGKTAHIKDIERILHKKIVAAGISIEPLRFIGFSAEDKKQIIFVDALNEESTVECDIAFDCTGSQRVVISQINQEVSPSPFILKPIVSKTQIKNHMLAYVKMNTKDLKRINSGGRFESSSPNDLLSLLFNTSRNKTLSSPDYAYHTEQLRKFGWHEFKFPHCYGADFTKGKVCLYTECPDNLPQELYVPWLQTVINAETNSSDISFQLLPPSPKPRLRLFSVAPQKLETIAFAAKSYPTVIAIGDAQIDPHYNIGHGIRNGFKRINTMVDEIVVHNGVILGLEPEDLTTLLSARLKKHQESIIKLYANSQKGFTDALMKAEGHYTKAILEANDDTLKEAYTQTLIEIRARIRIQEAVILREEVGKLVLTQLNSNNLESHLTQMQEKLIAALATLSDNCRVEKDEAISMLHDVAVAWKELGTHQFKEKSPSHSTAFALYEKAHALYQNPLLSGMYPAEELTVYSNMVICLKNMKQYTTALKLALEAIEKYPNEPNRLGIKNKLMLNLFDILKDQIQNHGPDSNILSEFVANSSTLLNDAIVKENSPTMLQAAAAAWKELGTLQIKSQPDSYSAALEFYEKSHALYQHPLVATLYQKEGLTIYSNRVICLRKTKQKDSALALAREAIETYPDAPHLLEIKRKIMFNLFEILKGESKESSLDMKWPEFLAEHAHLLSSSMKLEKEALFPIAMPVMPSSGVPSTKYWSNFFPVESKHHSVQDSSCIVNTNS